VPDPTVLTLDLGTSSVRAMLHELDGDPLDATEAQIRYALRTDAEGRAEVDPDEVVRLTAQAVDGCLSCAAARGREVVAVATSTMWHSLMGIDREGRPTTPLLTWADRRAAGAAAELRAQLDEPAIHDRTGCVLHSSYWPAKLRWLRHVAPGAVARTARWLAIGGYLLAELFGAVHVSTSMASGTGLFRQNERVWDPELLAVLGLDPGELAELSDAPLRGLRGPWARRWPQLANVPWLPATGDGACSNVGAGCVTRDRQALMVGTSGALRVLWKAERATIPPGLWCYRADPERFLTGGALSDGGNLVAWLRRTLRLPPPEEAERAVAAMAPDAHGLTVVPLLAGERGPGWADEAHGTLAGLSMATEPVHILRAALEAVALRFALVDELLEHAVPGERRVVATGGALHHSPAWCQILADALGKPIAASGVAEASSRGAALLALEALGAIRDVEDVDAPLERTYEPDPERHATYRRALERQRELYELTVERRA
jgi:gluconokinase